MIGLGQIGLFKVGKNVQPQFVLLQLKYEGCSINKLQNRVILLVFQIYEIQNIRFVENFVLNTCEIFLDDNVIIVTSSVYTTQSTRALFSPPVIYQNLQATNSTRTKKMNKHKLILSL